MFLGRLIVLANRKFLDDRARCITYIQLLIRLEYKKMVEG